VGRDGRRKGMWAMVSKDFQIFRAESVLWMLLGDLGPSLGLSVCYLSSRGNEEISVSCFMRNQWRMAGKWMIDALYM
jgi:hypothetical protein